MRVLIEGLSFPVYRREFDDDFEYRQKSWILMARLRATVLRALRRRKCFDEARSDRPHRGDRATPPPPPGRGGQISTHGSRVGRQWKADQLLSGIGRQRGSAVFTARTVSFYGPKRKCQCGSIMSASPQPRAAVSFSASEQDGVSRPLSPNRPENRPSFFASPCLGVLSQ